MKESFILYQSFYDPIRTLSDEDKGQILDAIFQYQTGIEIRELSPVCKMAFNFIKTHFERDSAKYQTIVERNHVNGAKGGRPKEEPKKPSGISNNPKININPTGNFGNPNDNDNDNDNVNGNESENESENEKKICVFSNPELHYKLMDYFNFSEQRNPDKLSVLFNFLNILNTDNRIDHFIHQFNSYREYKALSKEIVFSFNRFLGTVENRYLDGGWNAENWNAKLEAFKPKTNVNEGESLADYNRRIVNQLRGNRDINNVAV